MRVLTGYIIAVMLTWLGMVPSWAASPGLSLTVSPGDISSGRLAVETWRSVTLSGKIDASDLYRLGSLVDLEELDLSAVEIVSYSGRKLRGRNYYNASEMPAGAFAASPVTSVILPRSLTLIGPGTFMGSALKSVTVDPSVTSIGHGAFSFCPFLTSASIGAPVIEDNAFAGCGSLREVTFGPNIISIGREAFANTGLTAVDLSGAKNLDLLDDRCFAGCETLRTVILPEEFTHLRKEGVFFGCSSLETVKNLAPKAIPALSFAGASALDITPLVGDGLERIGDYAFANHGGIFTLTLPESLAYVGTCSMAGWTALTDIDGTALTTVPGTGGAAWRGIIPAKVSLTVRDFMLPVFSSAPQWRDFRLITLSASDLLPSDDNPLTASISGGVLTVSNIPEGTSRFTLHDLAGRLMLDRPVPSGSVSLQWRVNAIGGQCYILKPLGIDFRKTQAVKIIAE